jgi:adenosylcobinamide hydrolase
MTLSLQPPQVRTRREAGRELAVLVWRFPQPLMAVASAPHGGGLGVRHWVINAEVPSSYGRRDPDHHLRKLSVSLGLPGRGVGLMTAAAVRNYVLEIDGGVEVAATVGLRLPILAASASETEAANPVNVGTINIVALIPERLSDAALINAVATATEAKTQALRDLGLAATGTATDALCVLCPEPGRPHAFGGPRSVWGARLARAVHAAVLGGGRA